MVCVFRDLHKPRVVLAVRARPQVISHTIMRPVSLAGHVYASTGWPPLCAVCDSEGERYIESQRIRCLHVCSPPQSGSLRCHPTNTLGLGYILVAWDEASSQLSSDQK